MTTQSDTPHRIAEADELVSQLHNQLIAHYGEGTVVNTLIWKLHDLLRSYPPSAAGDTSCAEQIQFMLRQAELLDEQGHDVSAKVMRDAADMLALKANELEQQTRFKYEVNKRADRAAAVLKARGKCS